MLDFSRIKTYPIARRRNLVHLSDLIAPDAPPPTFEDPDFAAVIDHIIAARRAGLSLIWMMGAHVIKSGLSRLLGDENAPEYISNKLLGLANFKYLSSRKGIHVVGALLGLSNPWNQIAELLGRDKKALMQVLDDAVKRRNDIVHRADRAHTDPGGDAQDITFAWAQQAVDTIRHICLALDELVGEHVAQMRVMVG